MTHEIVFAGFGGQGVLLAGKLLAYAGMIADKKVSWIPAYGPEMRGGTASCSVIVSENAIGSPIVNKPSALVVMNLPSMDKFEETVKPGGVMIVNSSLIAKKAYRNDITVHYVPMNDIALECGNVRFLNIVALGALAGSADILPEEFLQIAFENQFGSKPGMPEANMTALRKGIECCKR